MLLCRAFPGGYVPNTDALDYKGAQKVAREFGLVEFVSAELLPGSSGKISQKLFEAFKCEYIAVDTQNPSCCGFSLESLLEGRPTDDPRATIDFRVPPAAFGSFTERARQVFASLAGIGISRIPAPGALVLRISYKPLRPSELKRALDTLVSEVTFP